MPLTIYCDNQIEGRWFKSLSPQLKSATLEKIQSRGANHDIVDDLVRYDRPDIILMADGNAVLVLEKTREVPTGHNVGQRVARLVRAAEGGVPTIAFFPFDAMKHGGYAGVCNLNIRLIKAFEAMSDIHKTPIMAVNWPVDNYHELVDDGTEDERIGKIIDEYVKSGFDRNCVEFVKQRKIMEMEYVARLQNYPNYAKPPQSVMIMNTASFLNMGCGGVIPENVQKHLRKHKESVVYKMAMSPQKCRREDPYTGTQFIYDYYWCRNGPDPADKHRNLILYFPKITVDVWTSKNPNDQSRKSCNWYLTANTLVFSDGVLHLR